MATFDDLYREEGRAELIGGRIVRFLASGHLPSAVAMEIFASLRSYAQTTNRGRVYIGTLVYEVPELPSGRECFSPDVSYYIGPRPANRMRGIHGAPTFAVEVRNEEDYGAAAEIEMAAKRADYFRAATLVVWDVDTEAETVAVYRATDPSPATIYRRGDSAEAEPAVPGG
jgi:Uma2 family endonuclease